MTDQTQSTVTWHTVPEEGQLVEVRRRQWIVSSVSRSSFEKAQIVPTGHHWQHLVTLSSIEEDALGDEIQVIWEIEPGARIIEKSGLPTITGFDDPRRLDAFLDAVRWGAATNADFQSLQSPFRSGIAIEDYQLDPVVRSIQMPRVNLLIADDVGLGKTIEAGLVIQELLLRHRARTVLVVCPASLQVKWKTEMLEKFGLEFRIVDTDYLKELRRSRGIHANPWATFPRLITSIDWLKSDVPMRHMRDVLPVLKMYPRQFDILVVDEAHNAAPAGSGNYAVDSLRTKAIRALSPHFEHRLFLTATPHNGYQESFTSLLELLDDQRFARGIDPNGEHLFKVMVRRLKEDIVDEHNNRIFPKRVLEPLEIEYTKEEKDIHSALVEYTKLRLSSPGDGTRRHATEFVLKLMKKRLFSSPAAFCTTLEKHRSSLMAKQVLTEDTEFGRRIILRAIQKTQEDYADDQRFEEALDEATETAASLFSKLSDRERELLNTMLRWADHARSGPDSKGRAILDWLNRYLKTDGRWTDNRVIIFTEYRATQKWLIDILTANGFGGQDRLMTIYGGMESEKREAVKAAFQANPDDSPVRILVATDAASEGIDLQNHCHMMIHAEIPWNPNVLEQRNGRIDRHGQRSKEVTIWHPVGSGYKDRSYDSTIRVGDIEGDLEFLMRAARKVESIRRDLGKVGPVIAAQVEEAMLGRRTTLDTNRAEKEAEAVSKQLVIEKKFREKVDRLHEKLIESREIFRMSPDNIRSAVEVALDIANLPSLQPTELKGAPTGSVFNMPAFQGTWARCTEGLAHPHTGKRRPITFDHSVAKGRDDVVLVHLNHRLVQMCLRLLRAEVWAIEDTRKLHRVTAKVVTGARLDCPAVVVWARLVITGSKCNRLHEELIRAGGLIRDRKFTRLNVTQTDELLEVAVDNDSDMGLLNTIITDWPTIEDSVLSSIQARSSDRMEQLLKTLERLRDKESKEIEEILKDLASSIGNELNRPEPDQLSFWSTEERGQLERNIENLKMKLSLIPLEIEKEKQAIGERYANPSPYTFPVAITFLFPESMLGERA